MEDSTERLDTDTDGYMILEHLNVNELLINDSRGANDTMESQKKIAKRRHNDYARYVYDVQYFYIRHDRMRNGSMDWKPNFLRRHKGKSYVGYASAAHYEYENGCFFLLLQALDPEGTSKS
ncbi:hypothetical protein AAVH_27796 [Aphelenchoides avenae]|nr:hypothetical protein AAVH_27796 [Aphelenchus avenae]